MSLLGLLWEPCRCKEMLDLHFLHAISVSFEDRFLMATATKLDSGECQLSRDAQSKLTWNDQDFLRRGLDS